MSTTFLLVTVLYKIPGLGGPYNTGWGLPVRYTASDESSGTAYLDKIRRRVIDRPTRLRYVRQPHHQEPPSTARNRQTTPRNPVCHALQLIYRMSCADRQLFYVCQLLTERDAFSCISYIPRYTCSLYVTVRLPDAR